MNFFRMLQPDLRLIVSSRRVVFPRGPLMNTNYTLVDLLHDIQQSDKDKKEIKQECKDIIVYKKDIDLLPELYYIDNPKNQSQNQNDD